MTPAHFNAPFETQQSFGVSYQIQHQMHHLDVIHCDISFTNHIGGRRVWKRGEYCITSLSPIAFEPLPASEFGDGRAAAGKKHGCNRTIVELSILDKGQIELI